MGCGRRRGQCSVMAHRSKLLWGVGRVFWYSQHGSILGCYCGALLAGAIRHVHHWLKLFEFFFFNFFMGMKRLWRWVIWICVWFVSMGWRVVLVVIVLEICISGSWFSRFASVGDRLRAWVCLSVAIDGFGWWSLTGVICWLFWPLGTRRLLVVGMGLLGVLGTRGWLQVVNALIGNFL